MGILLRLTKTGIRVALVVGAVKISLDNGVWSLGTNASSETYEKIKKYVLPGTIVYKNNLPSSQEMQICAGSTWNRNVNCAFAYISNLPSILCEKIKELQNS